MKFLYVNHKWMLSLNIIYIGYMSQWGENYVTYQGLKKLMNL